MPGSLRLGFDTEFVRAGADHVDDDEAAATVRDAVMRQNEVLNYSIALRNLETGAFDQGIIHLPEGRGGRAYRPTFGKFIGLVLEQALEAGTVREDELRTDPPRTERGSKLQIDLTAHFVRADLCGFRDFAWLRQHRAIKAVRGTLVTSMQPLVLTVYIHGGMPVVCSIRLYDTKLLAPAGFQSLDKLGSLLGLPKLELPPGYSKGRMDIFRAERPETFGAYAIRDAVIAEQWLGLMSDFFHDEFGIAGATPVTLGSAGVKAFKALARQQDIRLPEFLGGRVQRQQFIAHQRLQDFVAMAANSYHGGMNVAFFVGPSPAGGPPVWDIDIRGAYTTAMASIRVPDYERAEYTRDLHRLAVVDTAITMARVRFRFPEATRYPSLPVRADQGRGLVYPLAGEAHVYGPELVVAVGQGAEIEVVHGLYIPFTEGDERRPFADFTRRVAALRAKFKNTEPGKEKAAKEMGNSVYGKTAQAVDSWRSTGNGRHGKRVFNAQTGHSEALPPSAITSPIIAGYTTSLVRALLAELVASVPVHCTVYTATTDGLLTDCPMDVLGITGPVARMFARARGMVAGSAEVLELKHAVARCLTIKTRGTVSLAPLEGHKPVLARAGQRMEKRFDDDMAESLAWLETYRTRQYDTAFTRKQLISLRDQWHYVSDLVEVSRTVRCNLEFDFKRRLVAPRDVDGLLTADTIPWPDIETFERYRNDFESWRRNKRRCCITTEDFREFEHWRESKTRHQAVGMSGKARRPPLVQMFLRAWSARSHGLPGGQFKVLAEITSRWWPTTPNAIKLAKRHGAPAPVAEISPEERRWLDAVAARWPGIDWFRFIVPLSPAAEFAFAGNVDYWAAHMSIPDPLWEALAGLPAGLRYAADDSGAEGVVRSTPHIDATTPPARPIDPLADSEKIRADQDLAEGVVRSENAAMAYTFRAESRAGDVYKNTSVSHTDPCL